MNLSTIPSKVYDHYHGLDFTTLEEAMYESIILCSSGTSQNPDYPTTFDSHLVAALGIPWAHAVSIRLVLESRSGWFVPSR